MCPGHIFLLLEAGKPVNETCCSATAGKKINVCKALVIAVYCSYLIPSVSDTPLIYSGQRAKTKRWQWEVKGKEKRGEEGGAQALAEIERSHFGDPQHSCIPGLRSLPHSSFWCWARVLPE